MESMRAAIEKARLEAERDKHLRLVSKLQKGHHDTSNMRPASDGKDSTLIEVPDDVFGCRNRL